MKKIAILILILTFSAHVHAEATMGAYEGAAIQGYEGAGNNAYDPKVDPSEYGQAPVKPTSQGYNTNLNTNQFSSSGDGVPKLSLMGIVSWLVALMNQLVYVIIGAALVSFLYGILKLSFIDGHKPEAREQARKFMFWGIVSLFVMMSVWGLVNIFKFTLFGPGDLIIPRLK